MQRQLFGVANSEIHKYIVENGIFKITSNLKFNLMSHSTWVSAKELDYSQIYL